MRDASQPAVVNRSLMRITFVTQYYPPEMGAPAARVSELAEHWVARGHEVCVVTGFPQHPTGIIPRRYRNAVFVRESVHGVTVLRTWVYPAANRGRIRRSLSYLSFALSSVIQASWTPEVRRSDVVIATSPQFLVALSGWAISRIRGQPFVLEIRDLWPQSMIELGIWSEQHPMIRGLQWLEQWLYRQSDRLISVTDSFVETWAAQGVDTSKVCVIKNGVDLDRFKPMGVEAVREQLGWDPKAFVVAYVGTMGLAHGLDKLIELASRFSADDGVRFVLVGDGAERPRLLKQAEGLEHVEFLPAQARERVPALLGGADLVVVCLRKLPLFKQVIPSKLFEIMACARPVLLAVDGEAREILDAAGGGWSVDPEDVDMMEVVTRAVLRDPASAQARGLAGREFVQRAFDRKQLAQRYLKLLLELAG